MKRIATCAAVLILACAPSLQAAEVAKGRVFDDRNGNGVLDSGENGVSRVCVSNGVEVALTACGKSRDCTLSSF